MGEIERESKDNFVYPHQLIDSSDVLWIYFNHMDILAEKMYIILQSIFKIVSQEWIN